MKQNLAKVLGMEEHAQQVPNVLSEEQKLQQSQTDMEQYLEDHQQATEVALEAISNAKSLASVITRNNSTDKTTYELLKVAVEQLKEKTGVFTQSTALESIDKYSYKTEALQDVKEFIKKVWEAIKKAFFSMVDKVKAFFKERFSFGKKVEVKVRTAQDDIEEFEKNLRKHSEEVVKGFERAAEEAMSSVKEDLAKSAKKTEEILTIDEFQDTYSDKIKQFIGIPVKDKNKKIKTWDAISGLVINMKTLDHRLKSQYADFKLEVPYINRNGFAVEPRQWNELNDEVIVTNEFYTGSYTCILSRKDKKILFEINNDRQNDFYLGFMSTRRAKDHVLPSALELIEMANASDKAIVDYLDKISKDLNKYDSLVGADDEKFEFAKRQLEDYKGYFSDYQQYIQSCVVATGNLSKFTQQVANAIVDYVNETIEIAKKITKSLIKVDGEIEIVR